MPSIYDIEEKVMYYVAQSKLEKALELLWKYCLEEGLEDRKNDVVLIKYRLSTIKKNNLMYYS